MERIVIIGGGLSGLLTAYLLEKEGWAPHLLEARNRLGGRIYTVREDHEPPIEMGATWLGKKHQHLIEVIRELDIAICEQYMGEKAFYEPMSVSPPQLVDLPPNEEPSYRLEGGTDQIIRALADRLEQTHIYCNHAVRNVCKSENALEIESQSELFKADVAISTLPPKLLVDRIAFSPPLPNKLIDIAVKTDTWMAESIKVALTFEAPFWREPNSSGTIFSNVGPVTELYDHSYAHHYALKGFMNEAYQAVSRKRREQLVIEQLRRFYGKMADSYLTYRELVWPDEPFTYCDYNQPVTPHQHNGHSIFQTPVLDGRFILAGSETATAFPGYMDGAVESAHRAVKQLKQRLRH